MNNQDESLQRHLQDLDEEKREELAKHAQVIEDFIVFADKKGLTLTLEHFTYSPPLGITANYPNITQVLGLAVGRDKEGLFDFNELKKLHKIYHFGQGQLWGENYVLLAHPFFRRSFYPSSNYAPRFIDLFWRINDPKIAPYIALDLDRVRINVDQSSYMELDTWYGAKFNNDIKAIKNEVVKLRPPLDVEASIIDMLFANVYCFDILWKTEGNIKTFQSEEFKMDSITVKKDGLIFHPVRYVHAEYDLTKNHFQHFDGAIHYYTPDEYYDRRDSDMNYNSKNLQQVKAFSEKLFKLNGIISIATWIEFTSQFMPGNSLVFEYFEGDYPDRVKEILKKVRGRL